MYFDRLRRRDFITLLCGGGAHSWGHFRLMVSPYLVRINPTPRRLLLPYAR
jgi:hypothetical protein